jgi:hypothetical protein
MIVERIEVSKKLSLHLDVLNRKRLGHSRNRPYVFSLIKPIGFLLIIIVTSQTERNRIFKKKIVFLNGPKWFG